MDQDAIRAKSLLEQGCTCALVRGDTVFTSDCRGVRPLLDLLDQDTKNAAAADRVVGRGAAFLYCLLGVRSVYARVISRTAAEVLTTYGIAVRRDTEVDRIRNRTGDGLCPIESAVMDCKTPEEALCAIRETLEKL